MGKLFLLALAITASTPVLAGEATQHRFTRDGVTYVYTQRVDGERTVLDGRSLPSGSAFRLTVQNGRVSGVSGGVPVAFQAPTAASGSAVITAAR